ncbi:MAG: DUF4112 domain-containing protein [Microcoleaceae cyanobacterium]
MISPKKAAPPNAHETSTSAVRQLRQLSHVLDNAIPVPGTSYRIGLDPILGLIPGGGDIVGGILSAYIMFKAFQMGVPRKTLTQMATNIALESLVGTVPVLGDVFDVAWKANVKNVELLETHLNVPTPEAKKANPLYVFLLIAGLLLLIVLIAAVGIAIIGLLWNLITGLFSA